MAKHKYQLISSGDINDKKILGSDWSKSTTGHTQPRMVVVNATFP